MRTAAILILCFAVAYVVLGNTDELTKRHLVQGDDEECMQLGEECHWLHHCCGDTQCVYPKFFSRKGRCVNITQVKREVKTDVDKRGIYWTLGRCSELNEKCHAFQHCCGELDCGGESFGAFGDTCQELK